MELPWITILTHSVIMIHSNAERRIRRTITLYEFWLARPRSGRIEWPCGACSRVYQTTPRGSEYHTRIGLGLYGDRSVLLLYRGIVHAPAPVRIPEQSRRRTTDGHGALWFAWKFVGRLVGPIPFSCHVRGSSLVHSRSLFREPCWKRGHL